MAGERGEFTRKFDRQVLGDKTAEDEEREFQRKKAQAEDQAVEAEFVKVLNVLEYRSRWLRERFSACSEPEKLDFRGRRFEFRGKDGQSVGFLEFRTRLTDSQQAILLESFMQLEGAFGKRYDYVSFPKEHVSLDRAKRFIESKIFEFATPYQDAHTKA